MEPKRQKPPQIERIKRLYKRAYADWTSEEDALLKSGLADGASIAEIARKLGRKASAVKSRAARLTG